MSKTIKEYKVVGKINNCDVIYNGDASAVIMRINNICAILVEESDIINNLLLTFDNNKEYDVYGILKDTDEEMNKYLIDVFGKELTNKYVTDKILMIRRLNQR